MKIHPQAIQNADKATIREDKLTKYALDPESERGAHKAKVFKAVLGYDLTNYAPLLDQLRSGVLANPGTPGLLDEYGQRYTVLIPVEGPKGKALVTTGWIFKAGASIPDFATAYIDTRKNKNAQDI